MKQHIHSLQSVNSKNIDAFTGRSNDHKTILNRLVVYDENKQDVDLEDSHNKPYLLESNENVSLIIWF